MRMLGATVLYMRLTAILAAQVVLTGTILVMFVFVLGFVADPIINLYLDPWSYMPWNSLSRPSYGYYDIDDEPTTWYEHFAKGFASMGVLGFLKVIVASPFTYFRIGGGGRRATTGRERVEQVSWLIILIGVATFLTVRIAIGLEFQPFLLTLNRPSTKESAHGAAERSSEPVSESWTSRMMMMMTTRNSFTPIVL
jgi:hypothetical protein